MRRRRRSTGRDRINPGHARIRTVLAVLGGALLLTGIIVLLSGSGSDGPGFFEDPQGHFEASKRTANRILIGAVLVIGGIGMLGFALQGAFARYGAAEMAPVAKDTFNYVADGARGTVKEVARAVAEGIRGEGEARTVLRCHKCNRDNDVDAKFCDACGSALAKSAPCPQCGELNDPDAKFCDECGTRL